MNPTLARSEGPADAELISAVREGDLDAYGALFERHVDAARRLARQISSAGDADDLVSEAFVKVLSVLQRGGGPDVAFRAYLLTAVRRLHLDRLRATSKVQPTDDPEQLDLGVPFEDTAVAGFESAAAAKAFASLPERWQLVLWHTEVEGQKPAEVAALLGMSPNSVSALAYRAREGLRQAFLTAHVAELDSDDCRWVHQHLGAYVRGGISRRDTHRVEGHLQECRSCMAVYLELLEVNDGLAGLLAPLLLGGAGAAYLAAAGAGTTAAAGGLLVLLGRVKDWALAHGAVLGATAGVSATVAVVGVGAVLSQSPAPRGPTADAPGRVPTSAASAPSTGSPSDRPVGAETAEASDRPTAPALLAPPPGPAYPFLPGLPARPATVPRVTAAPAAPVAAETSAAVPLTPPSPPLEPSRLPQPSPTEPAPTSPGPTEPAPTTPSDPTPTEAPPTDAPPTDPAPSDPAPTDPAPSDPTPSEAPTTYDVAVSGHAEPQGAGRWRVHLRVAGIPAGATTAVSLSAGAVQHLSTQTPGCSVLGTDATCTLTADTDLQFGVDVGDAATDVVVSTSTEAGTAVDSDPGNDRVSVHLEPR